MNRRPTYEKQKVSHSTWLYGRHAVFAALSNPRRRAYEICVTRTSILDELSALGLGKNIPVRRIDIEACDSFFPGRRTQGILLDIEPLPSLTLAELLKPTLKSESETSDSPALRILALDHVQDERNVGAMLRTAYLLGVSGIIMTKDHAPRQSADLAHAACGAMDRVRIARVTNLARTLASLHKDYGFWCVALDDASKDESDDDGQEKVSRGMEPLPRPFDGPRMCLVVGGEGKGLRLATRQHCHYRMTIPTPGRDTADPFAPDSFNAATAVGLGLAGLSGQA